MVSMQKRICYTIALIIVSLLVVKCQKKEKIPMFFVEVTHPSCRIYERNDPESLF